MQRFHILGLLLITLALQPQWASATISLCNLQSCDIPPIDCGANGENSAALQNALNTLPLDENNQPIRPKSLSIRVTGNCTVNSGVGPFFTVAPIGTTGLPVAERVIINGGKYLQDGSFQRAIIQGSAEGSQIFVVPLYNPRVAVTISGFTIRNGRAGAGGAIANFGDLQLDNCGVENNIALNTADQNNNVTPGRGGAIFNGRVLRVKQTTFSNNQAQGDGAAIYNENGSVLIEESIFRGNLNNFAGNGGVIHNNSDAVWQADLLPLSITKSTLLDSAPGLAEIKNQGGGVYITNSTISQEGTREGIGIINRGGVRITYSTITNKRIGIQNFPSFFGCCIQTGGFMTLSNSIVFNNGDGSGAPTGFANCVGGSFGSDNRQGISITNITTSFPDQNGLVTQTSPCGNATQVTPEQLKLAPIGNYNVAFPGSLGRPVIPLNPGSVAIFAGDPDICKSNDKANPVLSTDESGFTRPQKLPLDLGVAPSLKEEVADKARLKFCDVGAFETQVDQISLSTRPIFYGSPPFQILASAVLHDDAVFTYVSLTPTICTVSGSLATILKAGTCRIKVSTQNVDAKTIIIPPGPTLPPICTIDNSVFPSVTTCVPAPVPVETTVNVPPFFGETLEQDFIIYPADLTITAPIATMTYGGALPTFNFTYNGLKNGDTGPLVPPTCTLNSAFGPTPSVSGSPYPTTCSGASDPNYRIIYQPGSLTVNKAPLSITATGGTMTYGGTPLIISALSFTGFVNQETASVLTNLVCGFLDPTTMTIQQFTSTTPAGTYQTGCTANAINYQIALPLSTCFANPTGATCSFATVTSAQLTITALSASMVYGDDPPIITPGFSGFRNGTTVVLDTMPTCSTTATKLSHVAGSPYPSTCTGASDNNYTIVYVDGSVTVTPAPLTIKASDAEAKFGTLPIIVPIYGPGNTPGLRNGSTRTATLPTCSSNSLPLSPIGGTYISTCSGNVDSDYQITYLPGTVVITAGLLQIFAGSPTIIYGEPIPTIVPTIIGLGIVDPALLLPPICSTTATNASPPGTYPTICGAAAIENFNIAYFNGILTIKKAPTTTKLTAIPGSIGQSGVPVDLTVQVTSTFGNPGGSVTIRARTGESCTAQLVNGEGKCQILLPTRALQPLTATYSGDVYFATSQSSIYLFGVDDTGEPPPVAASGGCDNVGQGSLGNLSPWLFALLFLVVRRRFTKA